MTLENAIVYYSEMAKECRRKARIESNDYMDMKDCTYEAEQLADWLNELKVLRERIDAQPEPKHGKWILDRSGNYCCSKCMEPCAGYVMMKPRDKFCKMCGSRNEVME